MRAVVDTNILVRALIKPLGTVGPLLTRLRNRDYVLIYSSEILEEFVEVLSRPRFSAKYGLRPEDVAAVLKLILLRGEEARSERQITVCRDPEDDKFLEAAVAGQADAIVSGDLDLLVLSPFEGIPILEPAAFLSRLTGS